MNQQKRDSKFKPKGNLEEMIKRNPDEYFKLLERLLVEKFSVGQVGIARQELQYWRTNRLTNIPEAENDDRVWSKVSFLDLCWLRIIAEMRKLGVSIDEIKKAKDYFYHVDDSVADHLMKEMAKGPAYQQLVDIYGPETARKIIEGLPIVADQINKFFTYLGLLVMALLDNAVAYLIITPAHDPDLLILNHRTRDHIDLSDYLLKNNSFYSIYLNPIIDDSFASKKIKEEDLRQMFKLSKKEKEIIKLIREKNIKELKIRFDPDQKKGIVMVELLETKDVKEMEIRLQSLLQEGGFKQFKIQTEGKKIVFIEETTKIKIGNN